jgi:hypothetical protein
MSALSKTYHLKSLLERCPGVQIVAIQETWDLSHAQQMPGFQPLVYNSRKKKHGGGVAFLLRNGYTYKQREGLFLEGLFESISISLTFEGK